MAVKIKEWTHLRSPTFHSIAYQKSGETRYTEADVVAAVRPNGRVSLYIFDGEVVGFGAPYWGKVMLVKAEYDPETGRVTVPLASTSESSNASGFIQALVLVAEETLSRHIVSVSEDPGASSKELHAVVDVLCGPFGRRL